MINKAVAKSVITAYLGQRLSPLNMHTLYEIDGGNDDLLLKHIKALRYIFDEAIKEIEESKGEKEND